ncbi:20274_t:CDS:2, partial [Funneliformis geosporum]
MDYFKFFDEYKKRVPDAFQYLVYESCSATPGRRISGSGKQSDASFVPKLLPKPAQNPCDAEGNPWPNIIVEVANSQSLASIIQKTTQFWLAPNRVEDVIVLKLWKWNSTRDQNGTSLRRLTVQRSPQNARGHYLPVQAIEFGTIDATNQPYNGCTAVGMCVLNISPRCIYRGCPRQPFANNVIIDLFHIQQEIFD